MEAFSKNRTVITAVVDNLKDWVLLTLSANNGKLSLAAKDAGTMLSSMASMTANLAFPCELINLEKACALVKLAATSQSLNQVLNNSQTWFILLASLTVVCKSTFVRNGLQAMRSSFPSGNKRKRGEDEARTNKKVKVADDHGEAEEPTGDCAFIGVTDQVSIDDDSTYFSQVLHDPIAAVLDSEEYSDLPDGPMENYFDHDDAALVVVDLSDDNDDEDGNHKDDAKKADAPREVINLVDQDEGVDTVKVVINLVDDDASSTAPD